MILFALTLCTALAGCNQPAAFQSGGPAQKPFGSVSIPPVEEPVKPTPPTDPSDPTPIESEQAATLYIGTRVGDFTEFPMTYERGS